MGQGTSCSSCAPENNEVFDPNPYIDSPSVTREDVMQLRVAFDYLSPKNGHVSLRRGNGRDVESAYLKELMREMETDANDMTFDDLYRLMKRRIVEAKRQPSQPILESSSVNASCLICPYAKHVDRADRQS